MTKYAHYLLVGVGIAGVAYLGYVEGMRPGSALAALVLGGGAGVTAWMLADARQRGVPPNAQAAEAKGSCNGDSVAREAAENRLRRVMREARVLAYDGEIRIYRDEAGGVRATDWVVVPVDIEAGQDFLPLDVPEGKTYLETLSASRHPEDDHRMYELSKAAICEGRETYSQEYRVRDVHGKYHWLAETVRLTPIDKEHMRFAGTSINITQLKEAQEAVQAAGERLRDVLRGARCYIFEGTVEAPEGWEKSERPSGFRWNFRLVDPEAAQQLLPLEVPEGAQYDHNLMAKARHPEDTQRMRDLFVRAIRENWSSYSQDYRVTNRNKQQQWLQETVQLKRTGERSWYMAGTVTDVTQAKMVGDDLASVMRQAGCVIWHGTFETGEPPEDVSRYRWSIELADSEAAQRVLAIDTTSQSYAEGWFKSRFTEDLAGLDQQVRTAITRTSYRFQCDYRCRDCNGVAQWISDDVHIAMITPGKYRIVSVCINVTAQKETEATLKHARVAAEQANAAKTVFLATMSHEIRTPMTAILGFADLLLDANVSEEERRNHVQTIRRNGEHLLAIINDILDLSKIEAGRLTMEKLVCSPRKLAEEAVELVRPTADGKGIRLELAVLPGTPDAIMSDPTRLRQILVNLTANAVKFTEHGEVRIRLLPVGTRERPQLRIEVTDTGIGMTVEQLGRLFMPFEQMEASTARRFGGTGLGLAISKRLAQLLGGDVAASSEVQKGSTFTATVDAPLAQQATAQATGGSMPSSQGLAGMRVLLAEDGADNRRLICFHLQRAGCEITTVENGKLAYEMALEARRSGKVFDVILMDMQMPVMDGYTATRSLREAGYRGPIIALTAHAMEGDRQQCMEMGCDDYATKPLRVQEFLKMLARYGKKDDDRQPRRLAS